MKKFIFSVVAVALFSIFYPGLADAGMYGEVYIPDHEFVGFYDETGTYTASCVAYKVHRFTSSGCYTA